MKQGIHLGKKFKIELVDKIKFYDHITKQSEVCDWLDVDCGCCGKFDFELYENELKIFYGDYPDIGYMKDRPEQLVIKFNGYPENFVQTGRFKLEKIYPLPVRLSDFVRSIEDFAMLAWDEFLDMSIDFYIDFMEKNPNYQSKHYLPF